jgi:hypothetical protein
MILDLLLDDVARNPEKVAPIIKALRPLLPTEVSTPRLLDAGGAARILGVSTWSRCPPVE